MPTTWHYMKNGGESTLRADHAAGDGNLKVQTGHGARFGDTYPARVTVFHASSGAMAIYSLSGRSADNLLIAGPIEMTTDIAFPSGSIVTMRWTEGAAEDIYAAVSQLESSAAAGSAGTDGQVQVKAGPGFGAIAGTVIGTNAVALGPGCVAVGNNSQAMGSGCGAYGTGSIATGYLNKATGSYAHAEGLQTIAGYQLLSCTISGTTVTIHASAGDVTADFACVDCSESITLSNLSGGSGPNVAKATIDGTTTGNGATFNGTNTILKLTSTVTSHTAGLISNGEGGTAAHTEGVSCKAPGYASHAQGFAGLADLYSKSAIGGGWFNAVVGSCQATTLVLSVISTGTAPVTLTLNGAQVGSQGNVSIREGCTYGFVATITARKTDGSKNAMFIRRGIIRNEVGTVSLDGSVQTIGTDINTPGWVVAVTADDTNNALKIDVTGEATVHWACRLDCVEVK